MAMQKHLMFIILYLFTSTTLASRTSVPLLSNNIKPNIPENIRQLVTSGALKFGSRTSSPLIALPTQIENQLVSSAASASRVSQATWDVCESWKYAINTNVFAYLSIQFNWADAIYEADCTQVFKDYMTGDQYQADLAYVWLGVLSFTATIDVTDRDIWIFDVDDTLLSTVSYQQGLHKSGGFKDSVYPSDLPRIDYGWAMYQDLQYRGFKIFLITGRNESLRAITEKNLEDVGYSNWERLIMRQPHEEDKPAVIYKSEKRAELENEGYTIQGNTGDQWSDLLGFPMAKQFFKFPNLIYYVP